MNNKKAVVFILLLIVSGYFLWNHRADYKNQLRWKSNEYILKNNRWHIHFQEEKECLSFLNKKMSSASGGIHTNYLESNKLKKHASGHEILSESEGLMMLYCLERDNKEAFDKHFELVVNKFMTDEGIVKWRIREDDINIANSAAAIDDLRIMKALIDGYYKWGEEKYAKVVNTISNGLLKYNIDKNILRGSHDRVAASDDIDLSYIDLSTINALEKIYKGKWVGVYKKGLNMIQKGYISDEFPFYQKNYNIAKECYSDNEKVNMIDTLLVVMHLSEVDLERELSIQWIKKELINKNAIYLSYNIKTNQPASQEESTAIYAIICRIAKNIGDQALYDQVMNKMLTFQVKDTSSEIDGSFGDIKTLQVYSFDNLQALLAF